MQRGGSLEVAVRLEGSRSGGVGLDVEFEVPPGITVMFGPSGAGKSTILAIVAGLLVPTAGRVCLGGEVWLDTGRGTALAAHKRGISMVFQSLALFPHLTGAGNVEYGIDRRMGREERGGCARAMLERMKVGHLAGRRPGTYSGGEAQRVALARAFARRPRVVLLDEAFSSLDTPLRNELLLEARAILEEYGIPAVVVTHDRQEARAIGDRAVLIEGGRVSATGRVDDLLGG